MGETLTTLGVDRMTVSERLRLVEAIWDSIPDAPEDLEVPDWQREELARRLAAADADP
jgi:putative addiction module component (TIGR02574 family)